MNSPWEVARMVRFWFPDPVNSQTSGQPAVMPEFRSLAGFAELLSQPAQEATRPSNEEKRHAGSNDCRRC